MIRLILIACVNLMAYKVAIQHNQQKFYYPEDTRKVAGAFCPNGYSQLFATATDCSGSTGLYVYCKPSCYQHTSDHVDQGAGTGWCGTYALNRYIDTHRYTTNTCSWCLTSAQAQSEVDSLKRACAFTGGANNYSATNEGTCYSVTGQCTPPGELPSCLDRQAIASAICNGGVGYYYAGGSASVAASAGAGGYGPGATVYYESITGDPAELTRPDGTTCSMFNTGSGQLIKLVVCPLGWSDQSCQIRPGLAHCQNQSSSSAQVGSSSGAQSQNPDDQVCSRYPELSMCQTSSSSGVLGGDTVGVDCSDIADCNWANLENQVAQLGIAVQTEEDLKKVLDKMQAGYIVQAEEAGLVRAVSNQLQGISGQLNSLGDSIGALNGSLQGLDSMGGDADTSGLGEAVSGLTGTGDTIEDGIEWHSVAEVNSYVESVTDTVGQHAKDSIDVYITQMSDELAIAFEPATDYLRGYQGSEPKINLSFDAGVMGIKCTNCAIDLRDINGFNSISFINNLMRLMAAIMAILMVVRTVKTGGHD